MGNNLLMYTILKKSL